MDTQEGSTINELLPSLYLEDARAVVRASLEVLHAIAVNRPRPPGMDYPDVLFTTYDKYLEPVSFSEESIPDEPEIPVEIQRSSLQPDEFISAVKRVEEQMRSVTDNLTADEAASFLGKLIRTWLLNATVDYLASSEYCQPDDDRRTAIKNVQWDILLSFESN